MSLQQGKPRQYEYDKRWADSLEPEICALVQRLAGRIVTFRRAGDEADRKQAADYQIHVTGENDIACRMRRPDCRWRDLTIRSWRRTGAETELSKIRAGFARWYLYGWASLRTDGVIIGDWVFVDLDVVRQKGVLGKTWHETPNPDGQTAFISIPLYELDAVGAIIECNFSEATWATPWSHSTIDDDPMIPPVLRRMDQRTLQCLADRGNPYAIAALLRRGIANQ